MIDIDFEVSQEAIRIATERVNKIHKLKSEIQVCINGGICPKCAGELEKCVDDNRNIFRVCLNSNCGFTWPLPSKALKLHVKKKDSDTKT